MTVLLLTQTLFIYLLFTPGQLSPCQCSMPMDSTIPDSSNSQLLHAITNEPPGTLDDQEVQISFMTEVVTTEPAISMETISPQLLFQEQSNSSLPTVAYANSEITDNSTMKVNSNILPPVKIVKSVLIQALLQFSIYITVCIKCITHNLVYTTPCYPMFNKIYLPSSPAIHKEIKRYDLYHILDPTPTPKVSLTYHTTFSKKDPTRQLPINQTHYQFYTIPATHLPI
jgi:hypothetical protein